MKNVHENEVGRRRSLGLVRVFGCLLLGIGFLALLGTSAHSSEAFISKMSKLQVHHITKEGSEEEKYGNSILNTSLQFLHHW